MFANCLDESKHKTITIISDSEKKTISDKLTK